MGALAAGPLAALATSGRTRTSRPLRPPAAALGRLAPGQVLPRGGDVAGYARAPAEAWGRAPRARWCGRAYGDP